MEKSTLKAELWKRSTDSTAISFFVVTAFYAIQIIFSFFSDRFPPLLDFAAPILVLGVAFSFHLMNKQEKKVPICLGIGMFFNALGLYKIIPYNNNYIGTLYGAPQLGYHYDWIVHLFGMGFIAIAFSSIIYPYLRRSFNSKYAIFMIILLCMTGFGALNEITEFIGFTAFGVGEGFMEFGTGDASPYGGPWENASMDMVNNLIGGIIFIGVFMLIKYYKEKRVRKNMPQPGEKGI